MVTFRQFNLLSVSKNLLLFIVDMSSMGGGGGVLVLEGEGKRKALFGMFR